MIEIGTFWKIKKNIILLNTNHLEQSTFIVLKNSFRSITVISLLITELHTQELVAHKDYNYNNGKT